MRTFNITYTNWKQIVSDNPTLPLYHVWIGADATEASHEAVAVYTGTRQYAFISEIDSSEESDWSSNYKSTSTEQPTEDDVFALLVGTPTDTDIVSLDTKGDNGLGALSVLNVPPDSSNLEHSWEYEVAPNTTGIFDIWISGYLVGPNNICYLEGGEYRLRTPAVRGSALHFATVDRDDIYGLFSLYGLQRTKITGLTNVVGTINVGDTVTGDTSDSTATVLSVNSSTQCDITYSEGPFTDGENLTFSSGATATLGSWVEGDVIELVRSVRDEWIEGLESRRIAPGGAKKLTSGLYFRVICYNADTSGPDPLRIKIVLSLATQ